ncbi:efflux RND transporter periplasmic adaptor subunit [Streptomyces sp. NRRL B-24484]|uniref:efflux RND transporter periplasmic adaptor subunit n=1 Tax=Streptomyces sp. NRRL B-24484 TaxID=1463833 RepID=UPI0006946997|nr:biotin/lipoyl-binding protein [Streptomyces sp. NRRL B-24484]
MKVLPRRRGAVLVNSALGVALVGGAALAYTTLDSGTSSAASGTRVRTATVAKGTVLATVSGSGTLSSPSDTGQDFVTGGRLTSVKVAVGDTVTKGQVLATVDTTAAQQDVDAAESALATARANLTKAKAGETVTTTTGGTGGRGGSTAQQTPTTTTTTKVDAAQVAQAQQQVDSAETALTNAETALDGTTLKATADGTVASVAGKAGDSVSGTGTGGSAGSGSSGSGSKSSGSGTGTGSTSSSSGTPTGFVVLTNPTGMQVSANFSELDSLKLKKGESATVTLNAQSDTKLNATVLSVSSLPSSSGGSGSAVQYGAVLQITSDTAKLRTGLSATISVVVGEANNALSVPTAALAGTGSSRTATVVHEDGSTERVSVTVGIEGDSTVQVVEGLAEGDKVELTSTTAATGNGFPNGAFPGAAGGLGGTGGFGGGGTRTGGGTGGTRTGGGNR